jgi:hypothetical protein
MWVWILIYVLHTGETDIYGMYATEMQCIRTADLLWQMSGSTVEAECLGFNMLESGGNLAVDKSSVKLQKPLE